MLLTVGDLEVEVRAGAPGDVPLLLDFIRAMAAFEKLTVHATEESLRDALFGDPPAARALLVFVGGEPIGYAIYFFSFSSMLGRRALWLDDLFIDPAYRGRGVDKAMMACLARVAIENRCARFEWIVLDWNASAIEFYRGLGAEVLEDWRVCRVGEAELPGMAQRAAVSGDEV